jgi:hypothetical protein
MGLIRLAFAKSSLDSGVRSFRVEVRPWAHLNVMHR